MRGINDKGIMKDPRIPTMKLPENFDNLSKSELDKMRKEAEDLPTSVKSRMKAIMDDFYKETTDRLSGFHEELDSEFHRIIKKFNLPMDKKAISEAGIVVSYGKTNIYMEDRLAPFHVIDHHNATIMQNGVAISRTISMHDERVDTSCLSAKLKDLLIKDGVLCPLLDDLKQMVINTTKTLQEQLDEPVLPEFHCTEMSVDPITHKMNRVVIFGKEYLG